MGTASASRRGPFRRINTRARLADRMLQPARPFLRSPCRPRVPRLGPPSATLRLHPGGDSAPRPTLRSPRPTSELGRGAWHSSGRSPHCVESEGALGLCVGGHLPPPFSAFRGPPSAPSLTHTHSLSRPLSRAPRPPCPALGTSPRELTVATASGAPCLAAQLSRLWVHVVTPGGAPCRHDGAAWGRDRRPFP